MGGIAKAYVDKLRAEIADLEKGLPPIYPFLHTVKDSAKPADIRIALRGDPNTPGDVAPRRFLQVLCDRDPALYNEGSGRAQLAGAIANEKNPLTIRVIVNRIWQLHFGKGIVRTPSNFGRMGERPTHPELLDYLAADFLSSGQSIKQLHRKILLSNTYAMAAASSPDADPENKLLSHFELKHRLEMETLRDSLLAVSGRLDRTVGGPSEPVSDDNLRRSLYVTVSRTRLDPAMALFDFPDANSSVDERTVTAGPLQALYWMNSKFVANQAAALNERLSREAGKDAEKRIQRGYQLLYARPADSSEIGIGLNFVRAGGDAWVQYLQALMSAAEFWSVN